MILELLAKGVTERQILPSPATCLAELRVVDHGCWTVSFWGNNAHHPGRNYCFLLVAERYNRGVIVLNEKEERLVQTIRALPAGTTDHILQWTSRLADLAAGRPIDWSDYWTDEDMRDATAASLQRFEESEPGAH